MCMRPNVNPARLCMILPSSCENLLILKDYRALKRVQNLSWFCIQKRTEESPIRYVKAHCYMRATWHEKRGREQCPLQEAGSK